MMNRERFSRRAPAWGGAYDASLMARRQPVATMPGDFVMRLSSADTVYMMVAREHRLALSSMTSRTITQRRCIAYRGHVHDVHFPILGFMGLRVHARFNFTRLQPKPNLVGV
jgi:hypothetical protein